MAPRILQVAAAQVGAIDLYTPRSTVVARLTTLLESAISQSVQLIVFPETTFTTFFPRHLLPPSELESFFEHGNDITSNADVAPLFNLAKSAKVDVCIGYAERADDGRGFNTCIYYSGGEGKVLSKYRKVHLPGTFEPFEDKDAINQLEKRYFEPGDLGFKAFRAPGLVPDALKETLTSEEESGEQSKDKNDGRDTVGKGDPIVGMMICNDRRWPEPWRCYALQGAELILLGYNTPFWAPHLFGFSPGKKKEDAEAEAYYHHKLVLEANSYMNACYCIAAARAGYDDGKFDLIGGSCIVDPNGYTIARAKGVGDELVVADIDLEKCRQGKNTTFDFARHRRTETYGLITEQTGVVEPKLLEAERS